MEYAIEQMYANKSEIPLSAATQPTLTFTSCYFPFS